MPKNEFSLAFNEVLEEKQLSKEVIIGAIESAMVSAYRRAVNASTAQHVEAKIDPDTGKVFVYAEKEVVEDVMEPKTEVLLEEARKVNPEAQLGDMVVVETTPGDFGRVAAQTARQVIQQHHTMGHHEWMVVGKARDSGAQLDPARALGSGGHKHFRRADGLPAGAVMFTDIGLIKTQHVEPLNNLRRLVRSQRRVVGEAAVKGISVPRRHEAVHNLIADELSSELHDGVVRHGPCADVAGAVAADAFGLQQRRNIARV